MSAITGIVNGQSLTVVSGTGIVNPYAVLEMHLKSIGGKEKAIKGESSYYKGDMIVGTTTYSYEEWNKEPTKTRNKIKNYTSTIYESGDDGKNIWVVKSGKAHSFPDGDTPDREIHKQMENYDYTDPKNRNFKLTTGRNVNIDGKKCYQVIVKNTKTKEVHYQFYDSETYLLKRDIKETETSKIQTDFSDYKEVNGIQMAYSRKVTNMTSGSVEEFKFSEVKRNSYISDDKFKAPESEEQKATGNTQVGTGGLVDKYA